MHQHRRQGLCPRRSHLRHPAGPELGGGVRLSKEKARPYGTIVFPIGPSLRLKGNGGPSYYGLGLSARF